MLMSDGLRWCMQYLGSVQPLDWIFFFLLFFFKVFSYFQSGQMVLFNKSCMANHMTLWISGTAELSVVLTLLLLHKHTFLFYFFPPLAA